LSTDMTYYIKKVTGPTNSQGSNHTEAFQIDLSFITIIHKFLVVRQFIFNESF